MNVFLDFHHHDLFRSLYFLFHKRLGFTLYIPYGMEWRMEHGLYPYPDMETSRQFLVSVRHTVNIYGDLPNVRMISPDEFKDIKIDLMVSTLPSHLVAMKSLAEGYQTASKHILQTGNNVVPHTIDPLVKNLLSSSWLVYNTSTISHKLFYHQEFDTTRFCPPVTMENPKSVYSLTHGFGTGCSPFTEDYSIFCSMKDRLSDFEFRCYGHGGEYGSAPDVAKVIREAGFIFHTKPQGDGYGHIYHNASACGKPVIYKSSYLTKYGIPMTPALLFDDETSVDLSRLSIDAAIEKILEMCRNYPEITKKVHRKFTRVVDFDAEFIQIKKFLEELL